MTYGVDSSVIRADSHAFTVDALFGAGTCPPFTADTTAYFADSSVLTADQTEICGEPPVPTPPATQGGGTSRRRYGPRPKYWWEAKYEALRVIHLPEEPESHEVAMDVLVRLQAIWRDLDERDVKFKRMLAECDRLAKLVAQFIESFEVARLLDETKQRIWAAEDARKARAEQSEVEELIILL